MLALMHARIFEKSRGEIVTNYMTKSDIIHKLLAAEHDDQRIRVPRGLLLVVFSIGYYSYNMKERFMLKYFYVGTIHIFIVLY